MTKDRWLTLMSGMGLPPSLECFQALISAYTEKHRFYHTTDHIDAMLKHLDSSNDLSEYPRELELAIWFHDAIYKPFSSTNELDSANWARKFLLGNNYDTNSIERIHNLIMATLHNGDIKTKEAMLMVDIDLTILGAPKAIYDEFEQNIRKEYKLVPSIVYRSKRKELLNFFLSMESIYNTEYFRDKFEEAARSNIQRAVSML